MLYVSIYLTVKYLLLSAATVKDDNISVLINIHHVDLALKYATRVIGIRAGEIVYDGPTGGVTQEVLDYIYNGAAVPQAGE